MIRVLGLSERGGKDWSMKLKIALVIRLLGLSGRGRGRLVHEAEDCPGDQITRPIREGRGRLVHEAEDCPGDQITRPIREGEGKIGP